MGFSGIECRRSMLSSVAFRLSGNGATRCTAFNDVMEPLPIAYANFSVYAAHMMFGGALCNGKFVTDIRNASSSRKQSQDLAFTC